MDPQNQQQPAENDAKQPPIETKPWLGAQGSTGTGTTNQESPHYQQACQRLSPIGRRAFSLIEFDDSEDLVAEIRKHWFGLLLLWFTGLTATVVLAAVPLWLLADRSLIDTIAGSGVSTGGAQSVLVLISVVLGILSFAVTALLALLYTHNVVFVTTEKIAQVKYVGLIHRKVSQLSIGDVQDSTIRQNTIPARIFNYGKLTIETAGEQNDFEFTYTPNPQQNTRAIIWAHEENMKRYGN